MNKYNLDLSKNVLGLNHKKELYTKNVCKGHVIGPLTKCSLDSGIKRGGGVLISWRGGGGETVKINQS